jgi:tetratricopeptide (TPR) repeat protein
VCQRPGERSTDIYAGLSSLVDKSLLMVSQAGSEPRLTMLGTIREFARARLSESGEEGPCRDVHTALMLSIAEGIGPSLLQGTGQLDALRRLDAEYPNIVAALEWSARKGESVKMLRLCIAIWNYWWIRGPASEGRQWIQRALDLGRDIDPMIRIDALNRLGNISVTLENVGEAGSFYRQSLELAVRHRYRFMIGRNLCSLGMVANLQGGSDTEICLIERSLRICKALDDRRGVALATLNLAISLRDVGDFERSHRLHCEAIALLEILGDEDGVAGARFYLGLLLIDTGRVDEAEDTFRTAWEVFERAGDIPGIAQTRYGLGLVHLERGNLAEAQGAIRDALALHWSNNRLPYLAECLWAQAMVSSARGEAVQAAEHIGRAQAILARSSASSRRSHEAKRQALMHQLETTLGERALEAALNRGRAGGLQGIDQTFGYAKDQEMAPTS